MKQFSAFQQRVLIAAGARPERGYIHRDAAGIQKTVQQVTRNNEGPLDITASETPLLAR